MTAVVVDANVIAVANKLADQADLQCVTACIDRLDAIRSGGLLVLDELQRILTEYRRQGRMAGAPGVGDAFLKWAWDNQANPLRCEQVPITPREGEEEDFEEFPRDPALAQFDRGDRMYVAVALASWRRPSILNAVDTDWWVAREALAANGVRADFLCPHLMEKPDGRE